VWYLEVFDDKTDKLVDDYLIRGIDEDSLRRFLKDHGDDYNDDGFGPFTYEIGDKKGLPKVLRYIDKPPLIEDSMSYFVSFYDE
jgi:hypothetical protein